MWSGVSDGLTSGNYAGVQRQYEADSTLQQEAIDAFIDLDGSDADAPVIPVGLRYGKRRSALHEEDAEQLATCEMELEDLFQGGQRRCAVIGSPESIT
jgi:hypothetical protein